MSRLTKIKQPIFAGNTTDLDEQIAVFGSMKNSPVYTTNLSTLLASAAYVEGWQDSVVVGYGPFMEEMNGIQYGFSYQIAYLQQEGIPEWDGNTTYYQGSLAKVVITGGCQIYASKIDDNTGNLLSDTASWKLVLDTTETYAKTTDVSTAISSLLETLYPVGAVYVGTQTTCPMTSLMVGTTWTLVSSGKALWTGTGSNGNSTIDAGLPNITGSFQALQKTSDTAVSGAFTRSSGAVHTGSSHTPTGDSRGGTINFNASRSSSIYGKSSTVQPPAYVVNVWRRTA